MPSCPNYEMISSQQPPLENAGWENLPPAVKRKVRYLGFAQALYISIGIQVQFEIILVFANVSWPSLTVVPRTVFLIPWTAEARPSHGVKDEAIILEKQAWNRKGHQARYQTITASTLLSELELLQKSFDPTKKDTLADKRHVLPTRRSVVPQTAGQGSKEAFHAGRARSTVRKYGKRSS